MKRLGIDLGVLDGTTPPPAPMLDCPGAILYVNRDEYDAYRRAGEPFVTPRTAIPEDKRAGARVVCRGQVVTKGGYVYALCASCAEVEARHREALRMLVGASR